MPSTSICNPKQNRILGALPANDFARINDNAPAEYRGLDRFAARRRALRSLLRARRLHPEAKAAGESIRVVAGAAAGR